MDALALRPLATAAPPTAQSSVPIAEMHDLSVRWGSRTILNGVNLSIEPGEQLVVVGPSGAGKSTVLRLLAGLLLPSSGRLDLNGEAQTYLRLDQQHPPDVRLVFQNPALLGSLSVKENVGFLLYRDGRLSEREITDRVNQALEAVDLACAQKKTARPDGRAGRYFSRIIYFNGRIRMFLKATEP